MPIVIRPADNADLEALLALLETLFSLEADFEVSPSRQRRGLQYMLDGCLKHRCIQVADLDGRIVGMASAQMLISTAEGGPVALVEDVVVQAAFRGQGVGRQLLASVEAWAQRRGATRLQLLADQSNPAALEFYQHLGWQRTQLICLRRQPDKKDLS
jgi:ribosomal protein S18 acetylase RimI-like enzyme